MERRKMDKYDPHEEIQIEDFRNAPSMVFLGPKTFGSTQEKVTKTVTVIRNDDSESTNSDTETWNSIKERNLKNLKRKAIHSRSRKQQDASSTDSSDDNDPRQKDYFDRKNKMSSTASSSSSNSNNKQKSGESLLQQQQQQTQSMSPTNLPSSSNQQLIEDDSSTRPPRKKKSRWSEAAPSSTSTVNLVTINSISTPQAMSSSTITTSSMSSSSSTTPMLTTITRSDPAFLNYARLNFGTINLSEEDWLKAEEHYKINLLFQDMQRKRQEIDQLAKNGKFKYEYDSDEDVNGGTWEHKLRAQEMEATLKWADALNSQCHGRHHIGDFLPPGEKLKAY